MSVVIRYGVAPVSERNDPQTVVQVGAEAGCVALHVSDADGPPRSLVMDVDEAKSLMHALLRAVARVKIDEGAPGGTVTEPSAASLAPPAPHLR